MFYSKYLTGGEHNVFKKIINTSAIAQLFRFSGIFRSVWLYAIPTVHLEDVSVKTLFAGDDFTHSTLEVALQVEGKGAARLTLRRSELEVFSEKIPLNGGSALFSHAVVTEPSFKIPFFSASSIIAFAILSLTLPAGLKYSSLTNTLAFNPNSFSILATSTRGVFPISPNVPL